MQVDEFRHWGETLVFKNLAVEFVGRIEQRLHELHIPLHDALQIASISAGNTEIACL